MNFPTHYLVIHAAYEHVQIDMHSGVYCDGAHPVHRYPDSGVVVSAVINGGSVMDLIAVTDDGKPLEPITTPDNDETLTHTTTLRRAWWLPHDRQTLHAESWVNQIGEGFIDLFIRAR